MDSERFHTFPKKIVAPAISSSSSLPDDAISPTTSPTLAVWPACQRRWQQPTFCRSRCQRDYGHTERCVCQCSLLSVVLMATKPRKSRSEEWRGYWWCWSLLTFRVQSWQIIATTTMMLLTVLAQPWQIMTMMTTEVDCFVNSEDNNDSGEDTDGSEDLKNSIVHKTQRVDYPKGPS